MPRQPKSPATPPAIDSVIRTIRGERVILVDCDLRRPSIDRLLKLPNKVGFTSVVAGTASLDEALQDSLIPGLRVLTTGPTPPNPFRLLNSRAARSLLRDLRNHADFVVIDTPPALGMADAQRVFANLRCGNVNALDVVHAVVARRVRDGLAIVELIAAINCSVRRDDFEIEIIHQRRDRGGRAGHIGVGERDLERLVRAAEQHVLLEDLRVNPNRYLSIFGKKDKLPKLSEADIERIQEAYQKKHPTP